MYNNGVYDELNDNFCGVYGLVGDVYDEVHVYDEVCGEVYGEVFGEDMVRYMMNYMTYYIGIYDEVYNEEEVWFRLSDSK